MTIAFLSNSNELIGGEASRRRFNRSWFADIVDLAYRRNLFEPTW